MKQCRDLERAFLREGQIHSVGDSRRVLEPVVTRCGDADIRPYFRGDAAFVNPDIYTFLEEEDYFYAIRLPATQNLQRAIEHLLTRPVGRPSKAPKVLYESFTYQAKSWDQARRVVAKVEWHQGELFPRVGFIVTNLSRSDEGVVKFYNGRGTAEQWSSGSRKTPPTKVSVTEPEGLFGVRKLACAFYKEACFRLCKVLQNNVLKALTSGSKLPSGKAAASYRTPHLASRPTFVGIVKEGKNAVKWTRLSCHDFVDNQVRLSA